MKGLRGALRSTNAGMTVTVVTQTPLDGVGPVAHGGATVVKLN